MGDERGNFPLGTGPEEEPGFLLWKTTITWKSIVKKVLEPHKLSHPQFVILALLLWFYSKRAVATQIDLVRMSKLDKMTVSKSLKGLVDKKIVKRIENIDDSRAKSVYLTESGKSLIQKVLPIVTDAEANFFNQLNTDNRKCLIRSLQKLCMNQHEFLGIKF
ncbi:MAG TPA: MarR family transcriptional regulator [Gammaproteobacteria bacterium]|nr:MarR family transcriptional regulator [Gammaproteobacteria bacterium]